ncbi:MAG: hypothetical protein ACREBC_13850 [Pyrinomonadaceae bacterium]
MKMVSPERKSSPSEKQSRSGILFPYFDLDQSIKVAQVIHEQGGGRCKSEQLAPWLGYTSTNSGTYMMRIYSAKYFGLATPTKDVVSLSERAMAIIAPVMPDEALRARVEAFLDIPLFAQVYERFKGQPLPPQVGLKNLFEGTFHIPPDRVSQALRVFYNSAEQAGFFKLSGDQSRLITPVITRQQDKKEIPVTKEESPPAPERPRTGGGSDGPPGVHSAIIGLLRELPPPGTPWNAQQKQRFLDAFKATIDFIYPPEEQVS